MARIGRRTALRIGGLALAGLGGCLASDPERSDGGDDSGENGGVDGAGDEDGDGAGNEGGGGDGDDSAGSSDARDDIGSDDPSTDSHGDSRAIPLHLQVTSKVRGGVRARLTLTEHPGSTVVYDRTHEFEYGETVNLGDHFESGEDYRFELSVDGETVFERVVYSHEGYILDIRSPSSVEIRAIEERSGDG